MESGSAVVCLSEVPEALTAGGHGQKVGVSGWGGVCTYCFFCLKTGMGVFLKYTLVEEDKSNKSSDTVGGVDFVVTENGVFNR